MIDGVARLSGPASSLNMAQLLYEGEANASKNVDDDCIVLLLLCYTSYYHY